MILQALYHSVWLSPPLLGMIGFTLAAIRLRIANRAGSRPSHVDAPAG
jgi:hypothetical protein